jgi:arginase
MSDARKVVLLGVPSAAGASRAGLEGAPRALREAGLTAALRRAGFEVVDLVDLALFPFVPDAEHPRARNVPGVACALRATADEMTRALREGFTLVLGGGCSLLAGVVAGARRSFGRPPGVVLLDAHGDLNTPETSPSGFLDGMGLALAQGRGPNALAALDEGPWPSPRETALVGWRELDPGEHEMLPRLAVALSAQELKSLGMEGAAQRLRAALPAIPLLVQLDVDVMEPDAMPAKGASPPGPALSASEVEDLLGRLLADARSAALLVTGYDPALDLAGEAARALVELLARACARASAERVDPAQGA